MVSSATLFPISLYADIWTVAILVFDENVIHVVQQCYEVSLTWLNYKFDVVACTAVIRSGDGSRSRLSMQPVSTVTRTVWKMTSRLDVMLNTSVSTECFSRSLSHPAQYMYAYCAVHATVIALSYKADMISALSRDFSHSAFPYELIIRTRSSVWSSVCSSSNNLTSDFVFGYLQRCDTSHTSNERWRHPLLKINFSWGLWVGNLASLKIALFICFRGSYVFSFSHFRHSRTMQCSSFPMLRGMLQRSAGVKVGQGHCCQSNLSVNVIFYFWQ